MALPLTNLTAHFDASVATNLWQTYQAGTPYHNTAVTADGHPVMTWDDADGKDMSALASNEGVRPLWRTTTPLMLLPCADFDGVVTPDYLSVFNDAGVTAKTLGNVCGAGAKTIFLSLYVESASLNWGAGSPWLNHIVIADQFQYWGLHLRNSGSQVIFQAYNYDGTIDIHEVNISVNTSYVVMYRHDGTNQYLSLNGGSETSSASGNTTDTTGPLFIGGNSGGVSAYDGRIGEIAIYNAALTGTPLTDALDYFNGRWISGGGGGGGTFTRIVGDRFALAGAGGLVT